MNNMIDIKFCLVIIVLLIIVLSGTFLLIINIEDEKKQAEHKKLLERYSIQALGIVVSNIEVIETIDNKISRGYKPVIRYSVQGKLSQNIHGNKLSEKLKVNDTVSLLVNSSNYTDYIIE